MNVPYAALVTASERVAATSKRTEKVSVLAALLRTVPAEAVPIVVGLLLGRVRQGRLGVGWSTVAAVDRSAAGAESSVTEPFGGIGAGQGASGVSSPTVHEGLEPDDGGAPQAVSSLTVHQVDRAMTELAGTAGPGSQAERGRILHELFARATPAEDRHLRQVLRGEMRQGANEGVLADRKDAASDLKQVTEFCLRAIAGRYPFASGSRADVLPDDFGQFFGAGGLMDDFFQRKLAPLVDTGGATWTYKPLADGSRPPTPAAIADFQRAARIKDVFFRGGGKSPSMKIEIKLTELEPSLKELVLDVDGQVQKLTTGGPSITVNWPAQRVATQVKLSTGLGDRGPLVLFDGPWALFRLFDRFEVLPSPVPERFSVVMNLDGKRARMDVIAASVFNPFQMREIKQFRCPAAL